jgi:hypothetical protein
MSEGPIKQWRDSFKRPSVSVPASVRICGVNSFGVAYCGTRRNAGVSTNWANVTCTECLAARAADDRESAN